MIQNLERIGAMFKAVRWIYLGTHHFVSLTSNNVILNIYNDLQMMAQTLGKTNVKRVDFSLPLIFPNQEAWLNDFMTLSYLLDMTRLQLKPP